MSLLNNDFIAFDGTPITGRVPTQVQVYADKGYEMSEELRGMVAHAYKLFCDAVKVSAIPDGYHVQNRELADGSKVRMESNKGIHRAMVWPVGSGGEGSVEVYRGLCYVPFVGQGGWQPAWYYANGTAVTYYANKNAGYGTAKDRPYYHYGWNGSKYAFASAGRHVKKDKQTGKYKDKIRGIVEGINAYFLVNYHATYKKQADGSWVMTDDVVTATGPLVFLDNQAVACSNETPLGLRFFPVRYGGKVLGFTKYGGVHALDIGKPKTDLLGKQDSRLELRYAGSIEHIYTAGFLSSSPCTTLVADTGGMNSSNYQTEYRDYYAYLWYPSKRYFSVSQDKSQVVMHGGDGSYKYFDVTTDQDGVHVSVGNAFAGYPNNDSVPETFTIARAYANNQLVEATWTAVQHSVWTGGTTYPSSGFKDVASNISYLQTQTYVLGDLTLTSQYETPSTMFNVSYQTSGVDGEMHWSGQKIISYEGGPPAVTTSNYYNILFWNPQDKVCMYYLVEITDYQNNLRVSHVATYYDKFLVDWSRTFKVTLYLRLGETTYTKHFENTVAPYAIDAAPPVPVSNIDETKKATFVAQSIPTEQGEVPFISYQVDSHGNYKVIGCFFTNLNPDIGKVHPFTEDGFVDWMADCGLPESGLDNDYRFPTCFLVGGPKFPEEKK